MTTLVWVKAAFNTKKYSMTINIKNNNFIKVPCSLINVASLKKERHNININKTTVRYQCGPILYHGI